MPDTKNPTRETPQEARHDAQEDLATETTPTATVAPQADWRPGAMAALKVKAETGDPKAIRLLLELEAEEYDRTTDWRSVADWYRRTLRAITEGWTIEEMPGDQGEWSALRARVLYLEEKTADLAKLAAGHHDAQVMVDIYRERERTWRCPRCGERP